MDITKIKNLLETRDFADFKLEIIDVNSGEKRLEKYHKPIFSCHSDYFKKLFSTSLKTNYHVDDDGLPVYQFETKCIQSTIDIFNSFYGIIINYENISHILNIYHITNLLGIDIENIFLSDQIEPEYISEVINIMIMKNVDGFIVDRMFSLINNLFTPENDVDINLQIIQNNHFFKKLDDIIVVIDNVSTNNTCYVISILTGNYLSTFNLKNNYSISDIAFNQNCTEIIVIYNNYIVFYDIFTGSIKKNIFIFGCSYSKIKVLSDDNLLLYSNNDFFRYVDTSENKIDFCFHNKFNKIYVSDINNILYCIDNFTSNCNAYFLDNIKHNQKYQGIKEMKKEKISNNSFMVGKDVLKYFDKNFLDELDNDNSKYKIDFKMSNDVVLDNNIFIYFPKNRDFSDFVCSGIMEYNKFKIINKVYPKNNIFYKMHKNRYVEHSDRFFNILKNDLNNHQIFYQTTMNSYLFDIGKRPDNLLLK